MYFVRLQFRVQMLQSEGQAFEDLFTKVMQCHNPNFRPVKPQGKIGDRKNDGFDKENGLYYQVYAPQNLKNNHRSGLKKLQDDFKGLYEFWQEISPIKQFYFVLNDKYKGAYPEIEKELSLIETNNTGIKCAPLLCKDIEDIFLGLKDSDIMDIVGCIPDAEEISDVDVSMMQEVVKYLQAKEFDFKKEVIPLKPDFEQKIAFNNLSSTVGNLLRYGDYQSYIVKDYFSLNSKFAKEDLRRIFSQLYVEAKNAVPVVSGQNDEVFFYILNKASPNKRKQVQDSVIVLMAYYFEYCDIFEAPNGNPT